jgi:hypothetical protein
MLMYGFDAVVHWRVVHCSLFRGCYTLVVVSNATVSRRRLPPYMTGTVVKGCDMVAWLPTVPQVHKTVHDTGISYY